MKALIKRIKAALLAVAAFLAVVFSAIGGEVPIDVRRPPSGRMSVRVGGRKE